MAVSYLRIYFLGMPFIMIFNFGSAILRSLGDTRRPLYILIWAGIINTVLNLLFVIVFHMGVEGVAIATGISNLFSAVMVVQILLREQDPYKLHLDDMHIQKDELSHMLEIGVPAGLQGVVFSISNVIIQASINSYGFNAVAGSAAALNFEQYCYYVIAAFNGAAISFVGQNYGAGNMDRVKRIFLICMGLGTLSCALLNWVFAGWSDFFLGLFTDSQTVKDFGTIRMRTVLMFQGLACLYEIPGSALRGMGRSMLPTLLTVFGTCVLRIAWVYTVCPVWEGFHALMLVYPDAQLMGIHSLFLNHLPIPALPRCLAESRNIFIHNHLINSLQIWPVVLRYESQARKWLMSASTLSRLATCQRVWASRRSERVSVPAS